jgi:hypothetical protein
MTLATISPKDFSNGTTTDWLWPPKSWRTKLVMDEYRNRTVGSPERCVGRIGNPDAMIAPCSAGLRSVRT